MNYVDPTGHSYVWADTYAAWRMKAMVVFTIVTIGFTVWLGDLFTFSTASDPGGIAGELSSQKKAIGNILGKELTLERVEGAVKETICGQKFQGEKKEWDHRGAVNKALDGLRKRVKILKGKLARYGKEMSEEMRSKYEELIGGAEHMDETVQNALDDADQYRQDIENGGEDLPDMCN